MRPARLRGPVDRVEHAPGHRAAELETNATCRAEFRPVLMRRRKQVSTFPAVLVAFLLALAASAPLGAPFAAGRRDLSWLAMFGLSDAGLG